jgi:hypothetical protein
VGERCRADLCINSLVHGTAIQDAEHCGSWYSKDDVAHMPVLKVDSIKYSHFVRVDI